MGREVMLTFGARLSPSLACQSCSLVRKAQLVHVQHVSLESAVARDIVHCYTLLSGPTHSKVGERNSPYSKYPYAGFMTTIASR